MYPFVRGKKPISKTPLSTGEKLGTGKLDNRLFNVNLVSPTDGSVVLVGNGYNGKFEGENPEGLDGYMLRKSFKLPADVPENGVLLVKFVYGEETVGDLDGYEIVNNQLWYKVHLDLLAKWDFRDLRIARNGTAYPYEFISKVDGQYAMVAVKITEALSKGTKIYFYTANQLAADASTTVFTAQVDNVVAAYPCDEEEQEVDPTVIVSDDPASFWGLTAAGSGTLKASKQTVGEGDEQYVQITLSEGGTVSGYYLHKSGLSLDLSDKNRIIVKMVGVGSGRPHQLRFGSGSGNVAVYTLTDDVVGERTLSIPYSAFTIEGTMDWASITSMIFNGFYLSTSGFQLGRIVADVDVSIKDYSGNGNDATAYNTQIVNHPVFTGKKARRFNGINSMAKTDAVLDVSSASELTVMARFKRLGGTDNYHCLISAINGANYTNRIKITSSGAINASDLTLDGTLKTFNKSISDVDAVNVIGFYWTGTHIRSFVNDVFSSLIEASGELASGTKPVRLGVAHTDSDYFANGILMDVYVAQSVIDQSVLDAVHEYPNMKLEAGKIFYHVYADHPEPEADTFGEWTSRRSYGVKSIYPSQGDCSVSVNWRDRYLEVKDIWVRNELAENPDTYVVVDGTQQSFWSVSRWGEGTVDLTVADDETVLIEGNPSLRITWNGSTGTYSGVALYHNYSDPKPDWSNKDFVVLRWVGSNSGNVYQFFFGNDAVESNTRYYQFMDDFVGLRYLVFSIRNPSSVAGNGDIDAVTRIGIKRHPSAAISDSVNYLGRIAISDGVWATLSVNIPDVLQKQGVLKDAVFEIDRLNVYLWDGTQYQAVVYHDGSNWIWETNKSKYLDGSTFKDVYGQTQNYLSTYCAVDFMKGKRGEVKGRRSTMMANREYQYDHTETKYAKAIAMKLKPNAGDYSATSGGNQVRLMIRIYFK